MEKDEAVSPWERPKTSYHAHFDCFSGAAGDMMLAACLDAAGELDSDHGRDRLLKHVSRCLEEGMPELKGEFALRVTRAWRGMGSIAASYVQVHSKYNHEAAPVPKKDLDTPHNNNDGHNHDHQHEPHHKHDHSHEHEHNHSANNNVDNTHIKIETPSPQSDDIPAQVEHSHAHAHESDPAATQAITKDMQLSFRDGEHSGVAPWSEIEAGFDDEELSSSCEIYDETEGVWVPIESFILQISTQKKDPKATGTNVPHDHSHSHGHSHGHSHDSSSSNTKGPLRNLPQIRTMLQQASTEFIPTWVKETAIAAFTELAHAEAKTHGAASSDAVHFHEVGAVDSIVDTVGTLLALHGLGVTTSVSCSRLPLGEGTVWTDHGLLPVPAPATLRLMVGMPTCPGPKGTTGELVTPTAAALLRVLVRQQQSPASDTSSSATVEGRPPNFTLRAVGIGAGTKDFEKHPNVLRLLLGDSITQNGK